ncbi:hypothetical protein [Micromonospora sp. NPDC048839]|uniref:calcium-binding protein n=1 Tax=Micromonospora sp. NPDC048839 TaxID=3155641 RepID=UPI0033C2CA29
MRIRAAALAALLVSGALIGVGGGTAYADPDVNPCAATDGDPIMGTAGDDILHGSSGPDEIYGLGGDDIIYGGGGVDTIHGGGGDDVLFGNDCGDFIVGGAGDDVLAGLYGDDHLSGANGADLLIGVAGVTIWGVVSDGDSFDGGPGEDTCAEDDETSSDMVFYSYVDSDDGNENLYNC